MKRILMAVAATFLVALPASSSAQKISTLPSATAPLVSGDVVPIVTGGTTKKASADQVNGILAQGGGGSHTGDTLEFQLVSATVPANAMGANGRIVVETEWLFTGVAGTKTLKVKLGSATILSAADGATTLSDRRTTIIQNQGATGSQKSQIGGSISASTSAAWIVSSSIDTTASQTVVITVQLGSAADTAQLTGYQIILYPKS